MLSRMTMDLSKIYPLFSLAGESLLQSVLLYSLLKDIVENTMLSKYKMTIWHLSLIWFHEDSHPTLNKKYVYTPPFKKKKPSCRSFSYYKKCLKYLGLNGVIFFNQWISLHLTKKNEIPMKRFKLCLQSWFCPTPLCPQTLAILWESGFVNTFASSFIFISEFSPLLIADTIV